MARQRLLIFHKALNFMRISVLNIHKLRKPIIPKFLLLKKLRKRKDFKLLSDSNNHGFLGEYQFSFSPSSTPLIPYYRRKQFKNREYLCSLLHLYLCLGNMKVEGRGNSNGGEWQLEALPSVPAIEDTNAIEEDLLEAFDSGSDDDDDSVDKRAERFIERFYQQMRMQRQESI